MTGTFVATWKVAPHHPPRPKRHCGHCGANRAFVSSGNVRLNASGKRLDAWLIYRCSTCDQTWNRPLIDRMPVHTLSADDLHGAQHSDPNWVRAHEFDVFALARSCAHIEASQGFEITKTGSRGDLTNWQHARIELCVQWPTGIRLDRVLSVGFSMSRTQVRTLWKAGAIDLGKRPRSAMRKPLNRSMSLSLTASFMPEADRRCIAQTLTDGAISCAR